MQGCVLLINAPMVSDEAVFSPPLGLLYLGAVLREQAIPVQFFDMRFREHDWAAIERAAEETAPCLAGFTCDTESLHRARHLSQRLMDRFPHVTTVLGGTHVTHEWAPFVTERRMVVRGEGEFALLQLASHVLGGKARLEDVPGLAYLRDGCIKTNPSFLGPYADVNAIPFPDYSLLPASADYQPAVITSRGCLHDCHFCSEGSNHNPYRSRSIGNVEAELAHLKAFYGGQIPFLFFNDDTFAASAERVHALCDAIDRVFPDKSRFRFFCSGRVNTLAKEPELLVRLRQAGLERLQIGIESGNQKMLNRANKHIQASQTAEVVRAAAAAGINSIYGSIIFGMPGQTAEDLEAEIGFAKHLADLAPDRIELGVSILAPYPGTHFGNNAEEWGLDMLDPEFATGRITRTAFAQTPHLSKEEIEAWRLRFRSEIGDYILEKAAPFLTPQRLKELIVVSAEHRFQAYVLRRLCSVLHFSHINYLRCRPEFRFLHEVPGECTPAYAPLASISNTVSPNAAGYLINQGSPFEFELTEDQMAYYRYFAGKLSFGEIAERVADQKGLSPAIALEECADVYLECEDCMAAIVLV